jgi:hypothetical protein
MASTTHHDLINAAKSIPRGIGGHYHDIIQSLTEAAVNLEVENHKLRVRIEELERMIDWKLDVVAGNAWIVRIEGDFTAIDDLLGDAVGHKIQSYEIATPNEPPTSAA